MKGGGRGWKGVVYIWGAGFVSAMQSDLLGNHENGQKVGRRRRGKGKKKKQQRGGIKLEAMSHSGPRLASF
jgi:hypothetical protein